MCLAVIHSARAGSTDPRHPRNYHFNFFPVNRRPTSETALLLLLQEQFNRPTLRKVRPPRALVITETPMIY